jgi:hypothetical protein
LALYQIWFIFYFIFSFFFWIEEKIFGIFIALISSLMFAYSMGSMSEIIKDLGKRK